MSFAVGVHENLSIVATVTATDTQETLIDALTVTEHDRLTAESTAAL